MNCDPIAVLSRVGQEEIAVSALAKLKGPKLVYPGCDTNRTDLSVRRYSLYLLHGTEIVHVAYKAGKLPVFDKADIAAINRLTTGDVAYFTDIAAWNATGEENTSPIRIRVVNDMPSKPPAEGEEAEVKTVIKPFVLKDSVYNADKKKKELSVDTTLARRLVDLVQAGKARAYVIQAFNAPNPMNAGEIKKVFADKVDSVLVQDVDGSALIKVIRTPFNYANLRSFRVLELLAADEETGKEELEIAAIAPVYDYYEADGKLLGGRPLFWIKFEDIEEEITDFESKHPKMKFISAIKADFKKAKPATLKNPVVKPEKEKDEDDEADNNSAKPKKKEKEEDEESEKAPSKSKKKAKPTEDDDDEE